MTAIGGFPALCLAATVGHWQFEEGNYGASVSRSGEPVLDFSDDGNHLAVSAGGSSPAYFPETIAPQGNQQTRPRMLSMLFDGNTSLRASGKPINTWLPTQWTIEATFKTMAPNLWQIVVGKDGHPALGAPPLAMKILGSNNRLEIGLVDGSGHQRFITSIAALVPGEWYAAAATATSSTMSLWLKKQGDSSYVLQGTTAITGAFFNYPDLNRSWTIGRGMWAGAEGHWFDGLVDEVRVSSTVLPPSEFLNGLADAVVDPRTFTPAFGLLPSGPLLQDHQMMLDMVSFGNPTALVLEGSSDLSHWRSFSFSSQSVNAASGDPRKLRLIVDELLSPDEMRHFFRTRPSINPLFQAADPDSIIIGDELWIFPTYRAGQGRVYAHSTKDLMRWTLQGPVFQFAGVPWIPAGKAAWAPSVTAKNGKFYLYYSVGPKPASIGVAVSNSPAGPYVDSGKALLQDNGISSFEAIDPMVYTDAETNISYLYAGGSSGSTLRIYQLTDDMINLAGQMTAATPNLFTEGAFVHKRGSTFYLSYSHGNWQNDTYSVHYSTSATPLGPWSYQGKILGSSTKHKGPGHHSIVQRPSTDEWFIIYHRWNSAVGSGPYSGSRSVAVERLFHTPQNTLEVVTMTDAGLGPVTFGP